MDWFEEREELEEICEDKVYEEWRDSFVHMPKMVQDFIRDLSVRVSNAEALELGEEAEKFDDSVINYVRALIFIENLEPYAAIDEGKTMQRAFKVARETANSGLFAVRL